MRCDALGGEATAEAAISDRPWWTGGSDDEEREL